MHRPRFVKILTRAAVLGVALAVACVAHAGARRGLDRGVRTFDDVRGDRESSDFSSPCAKTAKAAFKACLNDVHDDFFTTIGNCWTLSDPEEDAECRAEAEAVKEEDTEACEDRREARLEFCEALGEDRYDPDIDPADFLSPEQIAADPNPYFPLVPGNTWVYENEEELITVVVTEDTIEIDGVTCVVVRDLVVLQEGGDPIEDTDDFYAQDLDGNVWYFGEIAKNYEDGRLVDLEGSWIAGEDYAKPGILMPAAPFPGMIYRQEFFLREAEDGAEVVSLAGDESVPAADCEGACLVTLEFTPIEPDVAENKYYLAGTGLILEVDLEEGDRTELTSFTPGAP